MVAHLMCNMPSALASGRAHGRRDSLIRGRRCRLCGVGRCLNVEVDLFQKVQLKKFTFFKKFFIRTISLATCERSQARDLEPHVASFVVRALAHCALHNRGSKECFRSRLTKLRSAPRIWGSFLNLVKSLCRFSQRGNALAKQRSLEATPTGQRERTSIPHHHFSTMCSSIAVPTCRAAG